MSKTIILMLFALILLSSLVMVEAVFAQSVSKPSVPEFTVKLVNNWYDVPPTYTIDPYTGENITYPGHRQDNKSIELSIRNQPFESSVNGLTYYLFYNVRIKPHFTEDWSELYPLVERPKSRERLTSMSRYVSDKCPLASNSSFTVLSLSAHYSVDAQIDFQVEAIVGHDSTFWFIEHPLAPEYGGYYEPAVAFDITSGWSETQTLKIEELYASTPEPTSTPYKEPQLVDQQVILGVAVTVAVLVAGLGLLVYLIKRK